eukprot:CAMPEP_0202969694 /NCGR_PEP_ID=MMETSP1396-20130829/15550_1 /ASSEMBLY_ACC=CAM_ASM_000872 /TAXON_ID= /ORGANISM="Pseudokeronopsis sp., Strain Brazil" /LENGTH=166 /DNA_ID=CAMNT_0049697565 /DNA_START=216 /DNA_END=716 /DNA_ORIENTATION=-
MDAVKKLFEGRAGNFFRSFDSHLWRQNVLWCEYTDVVFKAYMPVIKMLYKENSGRYTLPGCSNFMSLEEFAEVIANTGICTDSFGQREIGIHFCLAKQTEVNELESERTKEMGLVEFIEAVARVADKLQIDALQSRLAIEEEESESDSEYFYPEAGEEGLTPQQQD